MRRANVVVDRAVTWLRDHRSERFFLLLHLFDPHLNYEAPAPFRDRFTGSQAPQMQRDLVLRQVRRALDRGEEIDFALLAAAYDEEIAFVDAQLGRLFAVLDELRLDRRVLVFLTADHGEEFGEHSGFEHGHSTFEEVVRVPLVLWGPGIRPGRRGEAVTLLDIAPTVYAALDLPAPRDLLGHSLLSATPEGRCLVAERLLYGPDEQALIRWPWKLQLHQNGNTALYDLDRDPNERIDVAAGEAKLVRRLLAELSACTADRAGPATAPVELDPEAERQLRSLGYVE
jgi:arylsulfatase A-like enzyme